MRSEFLKLVAVSQLNYIKVHKSALYIFFHYTLFEYAKLTHTHNKISTVSIMCLWKTLVFLGFFA
jgi:urate oxidase